MTVADFTALDRVGLNRQAVLNLDELPAAMAESLRYSFDPAHRYRQLILIGHAGKTLWESVKASGIDSENPIDDFSVKRVEQWFAAHFAGNASQIIYPGNGPVGLQALGKIAGWHHASPFMIGISQEWGSWYAYRLVILTDTDLLPSRPLENESPCVCCADKICMTSCLGGALDGGTFALSKCIIYRKLPSSRCQETCVARVSCPVGAIHRYDDDQLRHTYSISLKILNQHY